MLEKIKNTIKLTTDIYLEKHFPRIPEDKKQIAINAYEKDIKRLANFVYNSWFLNEDFLLSEDFIKWFHKSFYPDWYIQKQKDQKWREYIWMIPWEYKKIKIISNDRDKCRDLPNRKPNYDLYTLPENTDKEIKELINNFNNTFVNLKTISEKKDFILLFIFSLLYIHPFADWNGRLVLILCDLLFLKLWIESIWFMKLREIDRQWMHKSIFMSHHIKKDLKYIYDFIENNKT